MRSARCAATAATSWKHRSGRLPPRREAPGECPLRDRRSALRCDLPLVHARPRRDRGVVGADPGPHRDEACCIHKALGRELWDPAAGRFYARDVIAGHLEPEESIVSFVPLLDPDLPAERVDAIVADLASACFHPNAQDHFVVPSYSVQSADFDRRRYWRGPVWINTNWLLWSGLRQHGREREATEIARASLGLVARLGFREYFDPFGGAGYGSDRFSWSAALALDLIHRLDADQIAAVESGETAHARPVMPPSL